MKRLALLIVTVLAMLAPARAQEIVPDRWLLQKGDDPAWARPDFDDHAWSRVAVPASWESQGLDGYDGFGWYRAHFEVPDAYLGKPLTLVLGRVDDVDETFLNGVKIGQMGGFPPHPQTKYDVMRVYPVPVGLLKKQNVLAVRVYDIDYGGGINGGPVGFYDAASLQALLHPPRGPRASYFEPVTTNGLVAAVFDARTGVITGLLPHIFQAHDEKHGVKPVIRLVGLQRSASRSTRPAKVAYRGNTHVIEADYGDLKVDWFAPFTLPEKVLIAVVRGRAAADVEAARLEWLPGDGHPIVGGVTHTENGETRKYVVFGFTDARNVDGDSVARVERTIRFGLLDDEVAFMRGIFARCRIPVGLSAEERATFEQSITVLKMAQVSEREGIVGARGQILASLPPGVWNITWVRDGYYSTLALDRLGLFDEARRMLAFQLRADSGHYADFKDPQGRQAGVGEPYRISVCRYFGDGIEESDGGADPNIELDGFGLFLSAYGDYVKRSGDRTFYAATIGQVRREVADVLVHCIGEDGLMRPESGPWERHLRFKRFAWSSIAATVGLRALAALDPANARYGQVAEKIETAIRSRLVTPAGWMKGNAETTDLAAYDSHDGGTFEAFALGLPWAVPNLRAHFTEYDKVLRIYGHDRGYIRINKGDAYETGEWVLMDLRAASAWVLAGDKVRAHEMLDWVTGQAALNYHLVPEMYSPSLWAYDGSVPMVGFGAGAYVLAVCDLYGKP
mgnify:CR=1 FL=1